MDLFESMGNRFEKNDNRALRADLCVCLCLLGFFRLSNLGRQVKYPENGLFSIRIPSSEIKGGVQA